MNIDEIALRQIVREEMKSALKEVGLHDDDAGTDVRDLRSLITDWRGIKKTIWTTIARAGTLFVLGLLALGAYNRINGNNE
jgi:hypothetical protein